MRNLLLMLVLAFVLTGCSYVDRSNNLYQDICSSEDGWTEVTNEVLLEKTNTTEENDATNTPDISPELTLTPAAL